MLASPLMPSSTFTEEVSQYRPAKDREAFNNLLPPPIEFVEGSSSGALAINETKYQPINAPPKLSKTETHDARNTPSPTAAKSTKTSRESTSSGKTLYKGSLPTTWPDGMTVGAGLNNTGNTCFLNSALQCLLHTPPLLHVLTNHGKLDSCRIPKPAFCMACATKTVMCESHSKHHSVTPYSISTKLQVIAKHMRRGRQEDSHEFLRYAIDALQKSCLAGYGNKVDPKLAETTWVHKIFGGQLRSRVTCLSCGYNSDTFDSVLDLSVDIYGVNSLREALRKFVTIDHLKGADKYKCEKCKKAVNADKQFTVHQAPLVLTVHLKRFSPMGRKIGHIVQYSEHLSLGPVMSEGSFGPSYSLYGVISHAGGGPSSGHYYAHVKGADGRWYEMNDESVSRYSGAPTNLKNAYMLFYIRDKGQALEAAMGAPAKSSVPQKPGIVAGMKKRKVVESDDEDAEGGKGKPSAPFIGPVLPSQSPSTPTPSKSIGPQIPASVATPSKAANDPQADKLKKKIAAVQSPSLALNSLAQYDDSEDDIGEKVETQKPDAVVNEDGAAEMKVDPSDFPKSPASVAASPKTPSPPVLPRNPATTPIPASSFYGASNSSNKKRKSPDGDDDEAVSKWARTPMSPGLDKDRRKSDSMRFSTGGFNPYSRLSGGNNLSKRDSPMFKYGRHKPKKRMMI